MEACLACGIITDNLAAAEELVFVGNQTFQADRAAGMDLTCADTNFGAESIAETVCESG